MGRNLGGELEIVAFNRYIENDEQKILVKIISIIFVWGFYVPTTSLHVSANQGPPCSRDNAAVLIRDNFFIHDIQEFETDEDLQR